MTHVGKELSSSNSVVSNDERPTLFTEHRLSLFSEKSASDTRRKSSSSCVARLELHERSEKSELSRGTFAIRVRCCYCCLFPTSSVSFLRSPSSSPASFPPRTRDFRQTDRQTGRQTDRPTDRPTSRSPIFDDNYPHCW